MALGGARFLDRKPQRAELPGDLFLRQIVNGWSIHTCVLPSRPETEGWHSTAFAAPAWRVEFPSRPRPAP